MSKLFLCEFSAIIMAASRATMAPLLSNFACAIRTHTSIHPCMQTHRLVAGTRPSVCSMQACKFQLVFGRQAAQAWATISSDNSPSDRSSMHSKVISNWKGL